MANDKIPIPRASSYLSAVFAYLLLVGWSLAAAVALPELLAMFRRSPRLAAFGCLVLWLGPMGVVAFLHHYVQVVLDGFDRKRFARGLFPGTMSLWAGVFAWVVIVVATSVTAFVMMILFPKPPEDAVLGALAWTHDGERAQATVHMVTWMLVATQMFGLEARMKDRVASKAD
jgi:hypothetical protein